MTTFQIICERDVGLFSLVLQAASIAAHALQENRVPIVYYGRRTCYWTPRGYRGRDTVWEYYFEPVVPEYPVSRLPSRIRETIESRPPIGTDYIIDGNTFVSDRFGSHRGFAGESLKKVASQIHDPDDAVRWAASDFIREHIQPRPEIRSRADEFFSQRLDGRYVVGVHLRGTDALEDPTRVRVGSYLDYSRYFARIDQILRQVPNAAVFVASDSELSIAKMKRRYGDRVVATQAMRHQGGNLAGKGPAGETMPAYLTSDADQAAAAGEEAVIDYLVLTRCNHLVHNGAGLAKVVLLTVPALASSNTLLRRYLPRASYHWIEVARKTRAIVSGSARNAFFGKPSRKGLLRSQKTKAEN